MSAYRVGHADPLLPLHTQFFVRGLGLLDGNSLLVKRRLTHVDISPGTCLAAEIQIVDCTCLQARLANQIEAFVETLHDLVVDLGQKGGSRLPPKATHRPADQANARQDLLL